MSINKIRVAYLLGSLNRGGTETLLLDIFRHASEAKYEFIGIHRKGGELLESFQKTSIPLFRVNFRNKFDFGYLFRLRKLLKKQSIDVVHAQQPIDAMLAWLALVGSKTNIVLTIHGYDFDENYLAKIIKSFILKRSTLNIFVSKTQQKYYLKKYNLAKNDKQQVVYNGVFFDRLSNTTANSIRKEFNIPMNSMILCSVGNFVSVRDQLTICRFLALLKSKEINFSMIFAGARSEQTPEIFDQCLAFCVDNNLAENVYFPGSRADVPDILMQSDAFIYASDHDTFGIAVIEAMSVGLPVFVNDWEVMIEITNEGQYSVVYKTKDEYDLLEKFIDFLTTPAELKNRAKLGSDWVRRKYNFPNYLNCLAHEYSNLIKDKR